MSYFIVFGLGWACCLAFAGLVAGPEPDRLVDKLAVELWADAVEKRITRLEDLTGAYPKRKP